MLRQRRVDFLNPIEALARIIECHEQGICIVGLEYDYPVTTFMAGVPVIDFGPSYNDLPTADDPYNAFQACKDVGLAIAEFGIQNLLVEVVEDIPEASEGG